MVTMELQVLELNFVLYRWIEIIFIFFKNTGINCKRNCTKVVEKNVPFNEESWIWEIWDIPGIHTCISKKFLIVAHVSYVVHEPLV